MMSQRHQLNHEVESDRTKRSFTAAAATSHHLPMRRFYSSRRMYWLGVVALCSVVQWSWTASAWLLQTKYHTFPHSLINNHHRIKSFPPFEKIGATTAVMIVALQETSSSSSSREDVAMSSSSPDRTIREMALFLSLRLTQSLLLVEPNKTTSPRATSPKEREVAGSTIEKDSTVDDADAFLKDMMETTVETVPTTTTISPPSSLPSTPLSTTAELVPLRPTSTTTTVPLALDVAPSEETFLSLHQREGDRVIAMQDSFASSNTDGTSAAVATPTTPLPLSTLPNSISSPITQAAASSIGSSNLVVDNDAMDDTAMTALPWFTPVVPPAISKAFGRPLPISQEAVPPLQLNLNRTSGASRAAAMIMTDNEPYGE